MPQRHAGPSTIRLIGVAFLASLLCLMALPTLRAEAAPEAATVTGGSLSWGLKQSFRDYLASPGAQGEIIPGASATDDGTQTTFPNASGAWGDGSTVALQGTVRFTAHGGVLDISLARPRLVVNGSSAQLLFDVTVPDGSGSGVAFADVALDGHVTITDTAVTISGAPTTLTGAGAGYLDGSYSAGQQVDPLNASFQVDTPIEPDPTTEPTTEPTSEPTTEPTTEPTAEPTTEPTTPPASDEVTGGSITWGVKESYRNYLAMTFVGGRVTAIAPATDNGTRATFPSASGTWGASKVDVRTRGGLNFYGHHGEMDLTISAPRIVVTSSGVQLRVDAVTSDDRTLTDVPMADLDLTGRVSAGNGKATITSAPATLTVAGADMFNGFYEAGADLDPVSATFAVESAVIPPTPKPQPKPDPEPVKKPKKKSKKSGDSHQSGPKARAGSLSWGFKASFRSYITGPTARGSVSVSGGATAISGGYRFGQNSTTATPPSAVGATTYRGGVRFNGHHGELDLAFSRPSVRVTSKSSAVLSAEVAGRGRVDLAVVDLSRASRSTSTGWIQYSGAPAALTAVGSGLFSYQGNAFYPAGTVVDPVTFSVGSTETGASRGTVTAASAPANWTPPPTPPATTGLTIEQGEVRAGDEIEVSGAGYMPNEPGIRVVLYSTPIVLADDVVADASGVARWKGTIPVTVQPGEHTLTFQGSVDRGVVLEIGDAEQIIGCQLTDGQLDWGFKESFRAYVSGSIANGDWTTDGNATYATPQFSWLKGKGVRADDSGSGSLEFTGAVNFDGHDGSLKTTIGNPTVTFTDDSTAVLSVDYSGTTMEEAMSGGESVDVKEDVPFVELDLAAGTATSAGSSVTIVEIPTTLTTAGSTVFPNYRAGDSFDPVTLSFTVSKECADGKAPEIEDTGSAEIVKPTSGSGTDDDSSWMPWVGGALLGALAAWGGTVMFMRRRVSGTDA